MTAMIAALKGAMPKTGRAAGVYAARFLFLAVVAGLLTWSGVTREAALTSLADAYLQVTSFVAGTLALVALAESRVGRSFGAVIDQHPSWQVPAAALLGAFPGCGGAIVVITNYAQGHLSFGAVVAVLTATMGDAAFVLISQEPLTGLGIVLLGASVGLVSGYVVDALHGRDFLRPRPKAKADAAVRALVEAEGPPPVSGMGPLAWLWAAMIVPGVVFGVLAAAQVDVDGLFGTFEGPGPVTMFGVVGGLLCLVMWAFQPRGRMGEEGEGGAHVARAPRLVYDTNYVTAWVVMSFLAFETTVALTGFDLGAMFKTIAPLVPFIAILVGFIPGCGPQIVVTTLYVNGLIPLSAQIGNAISNDGDALFPAIAALPRAAFVATLYSAVPAVIFAYGYHVVFER